MSASPSTFPNHATNCSGDECKSTPPSNRKTFRNPSANPSHPPTYPSHPHAYPTIPSRLPHHPLPPTITSRQAKRQELYLDFLDVPGDDERRARDGVYHRWDISLPGGGVVRVLFLGE